MAQEARARMTPPRTRGDRVNGPRPCPWARCRWHLADATSESCALDVADRGGCTLKGVGYVLHLTRERVRQIEAKALATLLGTAGPLHGWDQWEVRGRRSTAELLVEGFELDVLEADLLQAALERAGGNKTLAAKMLGITRRRLYSMLGGRSGEGEL